MVYNINKVKYLLTTIITVASLNMFASQTRNIEAKEAAVIFKNIGDWFKDTEKYSVAVEFRTFNGHDATVPHEFKQGYLKKYGKNFHSMIMGSETMQNENYQIIIDTSNKFIAIKNAEKNIWEKINPNIIQKGLINEQSFSLTELNDGFQLKMIPSKSSSINYYEINYDKLYRIKSVVIKLTKSDLKEDGKTEYPIYPKVTIRFYNYSSSVKFDANEFNAATYLNLSEPKISGNGKYKNLKILDLRVKEKLKN